VSLFGGHNFDYLKPLSPIGRENPLRRLTIARLWATASFARSLTGGRGRDRFRAGGGNDVINAHNDDADLEFTCGESTGDTDTVNADLSPADPVTASASNCEVVHKS